MLGILRKPAKATHAQSLNGMPSLLVNVVAEGWRQYGLRLKTKIFQINKTKKKNQNDLRVTEKIY